ncbi:MAG: regulatory protein RecX [Candidatus Cyclobacteriaceae bacterium M2_1C_046]
MSKKEPLKPKEKAARYCSIQERSQQQVREKLSDYEVYGDEAEEIIAELISLDFINEERFARAYVRGKFRMKKWGRNKIMQGLSRHRISDYCIKKGFEEIDPDDYEQTMIKVFKKYSASLSEKNEWIRKNKIARYLISRGFESAEVFDLINSKNL